MNPIYKQLKKVKLKRNPFKKVNIMLILLCLSFVILGYCMYQMNVFEGLDFNKIVPLENVEKCSDVPGNKYDDMTKDECNNFVKTYDGKTYNGKTLKKSYYYPPPKDSGRINNNEKNEPYGCYVGQSINIRYSEKWKKGNKLLNNGFVLCKRKQQPLTDLDFDSKITGILNQKIPSILNQKLSGYVKVGNLPKGGSIDNVQVNKNKTEISNVDTKAKDNKNDIATNTGNIATNTGNIVSNKGNIASNDGEIATNTGNIATNTTGIGKNTTDIASMSSSYLKKDALNGKLASYTLTDEQKEPIAQSVKNMINDDLTNTLGDWAAFLNGSPVTQARPA